MTVRGISIDELFKDFDTNGDSVITFEEFTDGIKARDIQIKDDTLFDIFMEFDIHRDSNVQFFPFRNRIYCKEDSDSIAVIRNEIRSTLYPQK